MAAPIFDDIANDWNSASNMLEKQDALRDFCHWMLERTEKTAREDIQNSEQDSSTQEYFNRVLVANQALLLPPISEED